jgi:hypothetical protein
VRRVTARTGVAVPERMVGGKAVRVETDDHAQVLLDFGGACFAVLTTRFSIQQYRGPGFIHAGSWLRLCGGVCAVSIRL